MLSAGSPDDGGRRVNKRPKVTAPRLALTPRFSVACSTNRATSACRGPKVQARGRHGAEWGEFISLDIAAEELPDLSSRGRPPHLKHPRSSAARRQVVKAN
jgi:hypothetical protein